MGFNFRFLILLSFILFKKERIKYILILEILNLSFSINNYEKRKKKKKRSLTW